MAKNTKVNYNGKKSNGNWFVIYFRGSKLTLKKAGDHGPVEL